ncbi:Homeobox-leucine zipper protein HOX16 [Dichanthelium oligosanthes]|uniref:Homeobox-leucine zipper protein n=1 Tax=Dichanthelium oligosanthes TaxID=888268 RepID=A0A1E5WG54_9POAL|nr:Homeobox-leucine zipper protein HOX16 [Dichanthelium oligosanthes]
MESGRLIFNATGSGAGQMLFLDCGAGGGPGGGLFHRGGRPMLGLEEGRGVKRPFFTSPDELLEEEYYDEQLPEKKRRLTPEQVHLLERSFEEENKLEPERKTELARKLGLQPRQVAVWFQNRRARWKTKQLERDFDRLKASFDALRADHDVLLQDNHRLRSQVASLTEKLKEKEVTEGGASAAADAAELPVDAVKASLADGIEEPAAEAAFEAHQVKSEDRLSTGSGGSAVVDTDALLCGRFGAAVDSSVESYFPGGEDHYHDCGMGAVNHGAGGIQSDDDGAGSDEGCSYYAEEEAAAAAAFFAGHAAHHQADDEEDAGQISWSWMWN